MKRFYLLRKKNKIWVLYACFCLVGVILIGGLFLYPQHQNKHQFEQKPVGITGLSSTSVPGQRVIDAFYIRAVSAKTPVSTSTDYDQNGKPVLKPEQGGIMLNASLSGRTAVLPVGTKIVLYFPTGEIKVSMIPKTGIIEAAKGTYNLPNGEIGVFQVIGQGNAVLTVTRSYHSANPTPSTTSTVLPNTFVIKGSGKVNFTKDHETPAPPLYFEKTITDSHIVQKLYAAMLALPPYPTGNVVASCGLGYDMVYQFSFLKDKKLIQQGTMTISPCGGGETISLEGSYKREFYDLYNWTPFRTLLFETLQTNAHDLYGADSR